MGCGVFYEEDRSTGMRSIIVLQNQKMSEYYQVLISEEVCNEIQNSVIIKYILKQI